MSTNASYSVTIASGDALDVREVTVHQRMSALFSIQLTVVSSNPDVEFEACIGLPAAFEVKGGVEDAPPAVWTGICKDIQQLRVEEAGLSTYALEIVPTLWLATQRRNHRMFQLVSDVDVALQLLGEWGVEPLRELTGTYKKRKYRVQYGESDYDFICRMLEDAGVSFHFVAVGGVSTLVLSDAPHGNPLRRPAITFRDSPTQAEREHVTEVRVRRQIRPGRFTLRDHDYRRPPGYRLLGSANLGSGVEDRLEQYHYVPGAFLFESDRGDPTPQADDRGRYRADEGEGQAMAGRRLDAQRSEALTCAFSTNALDLAPGVVFSMRGHPRRDLGDDRRLLVVASTLTATTGESLRHDCEARSADVPYRPAPVTLKPRAAGVESATVVGPEGEEIHTDEFGRVRVHFHWDRESRMNEQSSCWIHVSQPWGGAGYGGVNLPRVGQEVLVDFLGADPDRPVITGRLYTNLQKVPYKLPDDKTQSGWKSQSTTGTGGYNEIMFEDAAGKELVRVQAEKDWHRLVKNDEHDTVGRDRTRVVKRNESVTVGNDRTKQVRQSEQVTIGQSQSTTVRENRSAHVGSIDSTTVGHTHVVMIAPPGEAFNTTDASTVMTSKNIVFDTGGGAKITMVNDEITLSARRICLLGDDETLLEGDWVNVEGKQLTLCGTGSVELLSDGETAVSGMPVQLNGPGLFCGRVTEKASGTITTGAALVLVGGASFPLSVVRLEDGDLQVGDHIIVKEGYEKDFQNQVMRDIGVMSTTPSGLQRLQNINTNPGKHDLTIREMTPQEQEMSGDESSVEGGPGSILGRDNDGNPVLGPGSDADMAYNPDQRVGRGDVPSDANLFRQMGHAEHDMYGADRTQDKTNDGWGTQEDKQTLSDGINTPNSSNTLPDYPPSPSQNDYLKERGYPFQRTDSDQGWAPR
jgi:type VI secretion system secreted protein VgrG